MDEIYRNMSRVPEWMPGILLRADGYVTNFYNKILLNLLSLSFTIYTKYRTPSVNTLEIQVYMYSLSLCISFPR